MSPNEAPQVARLIFDSTNHWYESRGFGKIFSGAPEDCLVFTDVYESLDPGNCLVAVSQADESIIGSCFYRERKTHMSLGIMNADPQCGVKGVAKALLAKIIALSVERSLPLRLVSSAFNLDSFSLYTKQGFAPYAFFQDMILSVPDSGIPEDPIPGIQTRAGVPTDVETIDRLEKKIWQTSRQKDWRRFAENPDGIWSLSVAVDNTGKIVGALASINHPGSNLLGPGIATNASVAKQLILRELNQHRGRSPVFLVPSDNRELVQSLYTLGARNCELHVAQTTGEPPRINGVVMPTFMPETG